MKQKGSCLISLSPSTPITSLSCFACCQFRKNHAETLNGANRMRESLGREKSKKCCSCWCLVLELYRDIMTYQVWSVLDGKHCRNCSDAGVSSSLNKVGLSCSVQEQGLSALKIWGRHPQSTDPLLALLYLPVLPELVKGCWDLKPVLRAVLLSRRRVAPEQQGSKLRMVHGSNPQPLFRQASGKAHSDWHV